MLAWDGSVMTAWACAKSKRVPRAARRSRFGVATLPLPDAPSASARQVSMVTSSTFWSGVWRSGAAGGERDSQASQPPAARSRSANRPNQSRRRVGAAGGDGKAGALPHVLAAEALPQVSPAADLPSARPSPALPSLVRFFFAMRYFQPPGRLSASPDRSGGTLPPARRRRAPSRQISPTSSPPFRSPRASGRPAAVAGFPAPRHRAVRPRGRASPGWPSCARVQARRSVPVEMRLSPRRRARDWRACRRYRNRARGS